MSSHRWYKNKFDEVSYVSMNWSNRAPMSRLVHITHCVSLFCNVCKVIQRVFNVYEISHLCLGNILYKTVQNAETDIMLLKY